jgi:hypothetical protein
VTNLSRNDSYIEQASRGEFYSIFQTEFCLENYLLRLRTDKRIYICKIRCLNLKFPIETGRWNNIPKHERFCNFRNLREIGNEFHYICTCQKVEIVQLRLKYIPSYFVRNPSENKLSGLLSFCNVKVLHNLAIFPKKISNYKKKKKSPHLPLRLYIENPDMLHKSYLYKGQLYLYCHV